MKKKLFWVCITMMLLTGCNNSYESSEPDCISSSSFNGELRLTIVANRHKIDDPDVFAQEILEMYKNNSFKSIKFSTDIQEFPEEITAEVYLHEKDIYREDSIFVIEYVFKTTNIVDITIF